MLCGKSYMFSVQVDCVWRSHCNSIHTDEQLAMLCVLSFMLSVQVDCVEEPL